MTVQELINHLQQVENKDKPVKLSVNDVVTGNFHLNDHIGTRLYLSNSEEEGYKPYELIERYEKALIEICRYFNYVGEPIEVYNIASKALNKHIESL